MDSTEGIMRIMMIEAAAFAVATSITTFALQRWLKRQPVERQDRARRRMAQFSDQISKILDGTARGFAILVAVSTGFMLVFAFAVLAIAVAGR